MVDNTPLFRASVKMILTKQRMMAEKIKLGKSYNTADGVPPQLSQFQEKGLITRDRANSPNYLIFCRSTREILSDITELRDLVLEKRRDYILCGGTFSSYGYSNFMSDSDRRKFDSDSEMVMNQCWKLIRSLETQLSTDKSLRTDDELLHLQAVIYLLNIYLKEVCKIIQQIREIYLKKVRQVQKICRLANLVEMYESNLQVIKQEEDAKASKLNAIKKEIDFKTNAFERKANRSKLYNGGGRIDTNTEKVIFKTISDKIFGEEEPLKLYNPEGWEDANTGEVILDDADRERNETVLDSNKFEKPSTSIAESEGLRQRKQPPKHAKPIESQYVEEEPAPGVELNLTEPERSQLQFENEQMYNKFAQKNAEIETIARQIDEIRRLQDTFAEHILEQEQVIDRVHEKTVYTLDTLEAANDFIRQAIKNSASRRVIFLFCLIVLTFTLLFLDWYNP